MGGKFLSLAFWDRKLLFCVIKFKIYNAVPSHPLISSQNNGESEEKVWQVQIIIKVLKCFIPFSPFARGACCGGLKRRGAKYEFGVMFFLSSFWWFDKRIMEAFEWFWKRIKCFLLFPTSKPDVFEFNARPIMKECYKTDEAFLLTTKQGRISGRVKWDNSENIFKRRRFYVENIKLESFNESNCLL